MNTADGAQIASLGTLNRATCAPYALSLFGFGILVGWIVRAAACVWFIYRIAKGWLNLNDNKPMPAR